MDLTRSPSGRRVLFSAYYFVEGAPIGFLWWTLPSLLRADGVDTGSIGALLGWLVLPWAFKWIWAPLIDLWQGPTWTLRAWIGAAQVGMLATLVPLLFQGDLVLSDTLVACLFAHAVFASTQDAAIDALMIRTTSPSERGQLSGWMQFGMLAGRSLLGGGALLIVSRAGGASVLFVLLAVIALGLCLLPLYRAPLPERDPTASSVSDLGRHLAAALGRRTTWIGLAFAATAGAGFEAIGAFAGPLLTERSGGATDVAGRFFLLHAVIAMAVGGLLGGRLTDRTGPRRGTVYAGIALAGATASTVLAIELSASDDALALVPWLSATYFAIGWFTAASYALFMAWTDERLGATQFSAFMGATNLCESWAARAAGRMIPGFGYGASFGLLGGIGFIALILTSFTRGARDARSSPRDELRP